MTEMFGEAWSPMSVPDLAPDDDDDESLGMVAIITKTLPLRNTIATCDHDISGKNHNGCQSWRGIIK